MVYSNAWILEDVARASWSLRAEKMFETPIIIAYEARTASEPDLRLEDVSKPGLSTYEMRGEVNR